MSNNTANAETPNTEHPSALSRGNKALREKNFAVAVAFYLQALEVTPGMSKVIVANLARTRRNYKAAGKASGRTRVGVCGWELSHNAAGRGCTLAKLYETFADVEMIGCILGSYGKSLWEPIRDTTIPIHSVVVEKESRFLEQALKLVAAHPYDVVHLSKARAPNLFIGVLYKLIWDARVIVDIDDEELSFVGDDEPIRIDDYVTAHGSLPPLENLDGPDWTRLAVGLAKEFDGITVSNPVLQRRYGGEIVRHARDERLFRPSPERKREARKLLGIPENKKVVLLFGTPRAHGGILETADAIQSLKRDDVVFAIVGDFQDPTLKAQLLEKSGVDYFFLGNQPLENIPVIVAAADYCVLLQDSASPVAQFQVPAKLSDALGMGLVVFANDLPPLADLAAQGALVTVTRGGLDRALAEAIQDESLTRQARAAALAAFAAELSFAANAPRLRTALGAGDGKTAGEASVANQFRVLLKGTRQSFLLGLLDGYKPQSPSQGKARHSPESEILSKSIENTIDHYSIPPEFAGHNSVLFDETWYLDKYKKIVNGKMDPFKYFLENGWKEGHCPNAFFDTGWYLKRYKDVAAKNINPILHFITQGSSEGRNPGRLFDTAFYLNSNRDVVRANLNPLAHYIKSGLREGRKPHSEFVIVDIKENDHEEINSSNYAQKYISIMDSLGVPLFPQRPLTPKEEPALPTPVVVRRDPTISLTKKVASNTRNHIAVFSVNVGRREPILKIEPVEGADFFLFTDYLGCDSTGWLLLPLDYFENDAKRTSLYYKTHPHRYFADYDYVLWCDQNVKLMVNSISNLMNLQNPPKIASYAHWGRDCLYDEAEAIIKSQRETEEIVRLQIERYRSEGFPEHFGLFETNVMFLQHLDKNVTLLNETWWREIVAGARRDQLSFTYSLWRHGLKCSYIEEPPETARTSRKVKYFFHD